VEEAEEVEATRLLINQNGYDTWNVTTVCQACYHKSNEKQNELIAEKNRPKKLRGQLDEMQALLAALQACEQAGVTLSDEEMAEVTARMEKLGVKL
jgi:cytochrome c553